jgi:DNA-binding GntR family transcriptional regulator
MVSLSRITVTPDLTEQVYQRLLYAICDGALVPGARLTQEDLAATLGVSRQQPYRHSAHPPRASTA